jgi:hypothetical protein
MPIFELDDKSTKGSRQTHEPLLEVAHPPQLRMGAGHSQWNTLDQDTKVRDLTSWVHALRQPEPALTSGNAVGAGFVSTGSSMPTTPATPWQPPASGPSWALTPTALGTCCVWAGALLVVAPPGCQDTGERTQPCAGSRSGPADAGAVPERAEPVRPCRCIVTALNRRELPRNLYQVATGSQGRPDKGLAPASLVELPLSRRCPSSGVEQLTDPVTGCRSSDGLAVRIDIGRTRAVA